MTGLVVGREDKVLLTLSGALYETDWLMPHVLLTQVHPGRLREALRFAQQAEATWEGP